MGALEIWDIGFVFLLCFPIIFSSNFFIISTLNFNLHFYKPILCMIYWNSSLHKKLVLHRYLLLAIIAVKMFVLVDKE